MNKREMHMKQVILVFKNIVIEQYILVTDVSMKF